MNNKSAILSIVLHAHLPYVRHPEYEHFHEESWLFEAISESYIPLIDVLERLQTSRFKLSLSLSPTLIAMLKDELLQQRYRIYLNQRISLAEKEIWRNRNNKSLQKLSRLYYRFFQHTAQRFEHYQGNLINAFKQLQQNNVLELLTSSATHSYLPLINVNDTAVYNQIKIGLDYFESVFNFRPKGYWLPECGYFQGLENLLAHEGIEYFYTDAHALREASCTPKHDIYAAIKCENGVNVFARDPQLCELIWGGEGYPAHPVYREFHHDIGFELDRDYLNGYILEDQSRVFTGIKYHQISESDPKQHYEPRQAMRQVQHDVNDFIHQLEQKTEQIKQTMDDQAIITLAFDAELFGHWWFEGPQWLEQLILQTENHTAFEINSNQHYLNKNPALQTGTPAPSSWGKAGYSDYWLNQENDWIYPFLHKAGDEMEKLCKDLTGITVTDLQHRATNQAMRSLLLAQASDWPFMMKSGKNSQYAEKRISDHLARFNYLHEGIRQNKLDENYLLALELMDNIFPELDFKQLKQP